MSLRTSRQAATLDCFRAVKTREAAIFRAMRIRQVLRNLVFTLSVVAIVLVSVAMGFFAGLTATRTVDGTALPLTGAACYAR